VTYSPDAAHSAYDLASHFQHCFPPQPVPDALLEITPCEDGLLLTGLFPAALPVELPVFLVPVFVLNTAFVFWPVFDGDAFCDAIGRNE